MSPRSKFLYEFTDSFRFSISYPLFSISLSKISVAGHILFNTFIGLLSKTLKQDGTNPPSVSRGGQQRSGDILRRFSAISRRRTNLEDLSARMLHETGRFRIPHKKEKKTVTVQSCFAACRRARSYNTKAKTRPTLNATTGACTWPCTWKGAYD